MKTLLGVIAFMSVLIGFSLLHVSFPQTASIEQSITGPVQDTTIEVGLPMRLMIARLGIDAPIVGVSLTSLGAMEAPEQQEHVGWFKLGTQPGDVGSAVVAGHYGARDSVFNTLHLLEVGDRIVTIDDKGNETAFIVRLRKRYGATEDAKDVFTSYDGLSHLNLIACEGDWDSLTQSYPLRLVVFADKEVH